MFNKIKSLGQTSPLLKQQQLLGRIKETKLFDKVYHPFPMILFTMY